MIGTTPLHTGDEITQAIDWVGRNTLAAANAALGAAEEALEFAGDAVDTLEKGFAAAGDGVSCSC